MSRRRQPLGRGLGALLPPAKARPVPRPGAEPDDPGHAAAPAPGQAPSGPTLRSLDIDRLQPAKDQPRRDFDDEALEQLADSVRTHGIIQPILATPEPGGHYRIIAGERRWRAAQRAGLHEVPVVVRAVDKTERLEIALIENLQREDLNPIEEAQALAHLCEIGGYTHEALAQRVGKDRATVSNAMRLLNLPASTQALVRDGSLGMGHARALLGLPSPGAMIAAAREVVRRGLSVRATEALVRKQVRGEREPDAEPDDEAQRRAIIVRELEGRLRRRLGVRAQLKSSSTKGRGVLEIPYGNLDELDRVLAAILGPSDGTVD